LNAASLTRDDFGTLNVTANQRSGSQPPDSFLTLDTTPALSDDLIGGWAVAITNVADFATYDPTQGVVHLPTANRPGDLDASVDETSNVYLTAAPTPLTGNRVINSLNYRVDNATTIDLAGHQLDIDSGGMIFTGNNRRVTITPGQIVAGNGSPNPQIIFHGNGGGEGFLEGGDGLGADVVEGIEDLEGAEFLEGDIGEGAGVEFGAAPGEVPAGGTLISGPGGPASPPLWTLILGALVGGLILNIMPCVFPILSLKALSLARAGGPFAPRSCCARRATHGVTSSPRESPRRLQCREGQWLPPPLRCRY